MTTKTQTEVVRARHTIVWTDEEVDRGNDGKTTSKSGQALHGIPYYRKLRTARSGGSWLYNLQWCPNGQPDYGIDRIRRF